MAGISVLAPAKLNLFLHIVGKRQDGYHLLESLVVFTEFGDRLEVFPAHMLSLEITGQFANDLQESIETNHVLKAARLLQPYAGGQGARIMLHKSIPTGAGLGGGSSDAAAAIRVLCELWNILPAKKILQDIALNIGSDVPVCLEGTSAIMSGIGEVVSPVNLKEYPYVLLINPRKPLLTASVYKQFSGAFAGAGFSIRGSLFDSLGGTYNMLESPATALMPVLKDILSAVKSTKGCRLARMSGSGATCFGLYDTQEEAQAAKAALASQYQDAWYMITRIKNGR